MESREEVEPKRVFLVTRNPQFLNTMGDYLSIWGHQVISQHSTKFDLSEIGELDVFVGQVNGNNKGYDILNKVRAKYPYCRVVLFSEQQFPRSQRVLLSQFVDEVLEVPFALEDLNWIISRLEASGPEDYFINVNNLA